MHLEVSLWHTSDSLFLCATDAISVRVLRGCTHMVKCICTSKCYGKSLCSYVSIPHLSIPYLVTLNHMF